MKKVRVPIHRTSPTQSVLIDPAATNGAQFGVNLLDPAGNLVTWPIVAPVPNSGDLSNFTTDDIDEGAYHFYFTAERARDAVGAILADSANVTLRYVDDGENPGSIVADLTDASITTGGTLQKRTFDAKGRLSEQDDATTDDLPEGDDNLYFTDDRADARVADGIAAHVAEDDPHPQYVKPDSPAPTVTGSRGGNAALASLLTVLAAYGLITDSTT